MAPAIMEDCRTLALQWKDEFQLRRCDIMAAEKLEEDTNETTSKGIHDDGATAGYLLELGMNGYPGGPPAPEHTLH